MTGTGRLGQGHFLASPGSVDFLKIFRQGQCRAAKHHTPRLGHDNPLHQTQADIANCNKELKTSQSEWTKAGKSLESFGKSCDNVSKNLTKAGKLLSTTLTTPIVALGTAAIKSSIDFESSFTSVRKTVDATETEFDQLASTSKRMSSEVAAGTDEINEVMAAGGQLGVATAHQTDITRV